MSKRDAARSRWRADLHEYGAAALRAAGLSEMADGSDEEVEYNRAYADLMDDLADAKEAARAGKSGSKEILAATKARVDAFRLAADASLRPKPGIVNNISEPSDAELAALGY